MRVLFEITHPKHAHLFHYAIAALRLQGSQVAITAREKDVTTRLLDAWRETIGPYHVLSSRRSSGLTALAAELMVRNKRLFTFCRRFKPDLIVARVGPSAAQIGRLLGIPVVVFEDTDDARLQQWISFPFATHVCTAEHYAKNWGRKHIRYPGFDELAYLHPNRFHPDPRIPRDAGLVPGEYTVVRLVSWQAAHDIGQSGIHREKQLDALRCLEQYGRVIITSEAALPEVLEPYRLPVAPHLFHHVLAHAKMTFGESSTVATEGAVLGVPGILINTMFWSSIQRLESIGLIAQTRDLDRAIHLAGEWLDNPDNLVHRSARRDDLLAECADLTDWMLRLFRSMASQNH